MPLLPDQTVATDISSSSPILGEAEAEKAISPRKRLQMAWKLFETLENQIQVADSKVQAVFGVNALLVAALSLQSRQSTWSEMRAAGFGTAHFLGLVVRIAFLLCVSVATGAAIAALRPRMGRTRIGRDSGAVPLPPAMPSLFFFNDIARKPPQEFREAFFGLTTEEATRHIVSQSHAVARILAAKYRFAGLSVRALAAALLLWALLQVIDFLS